MVLTSRSWALATAATVLATGVATAQLQFIAPPLLPAGKAQISGVVLTDTGAPAPGAKVIVNTLCRAFEECYSPRETRTDSAGKFVLAGVPSQPLTLQADMPGFSPASFGEAGPGLPGTPIQLDPEERLDVVMRLARGATLRGFVFDADGVPAKGIELYAFRLEPLGAGHDLMGGFSLQERRGRTLSNDQGEFELSDLPPGRYLLGGYRDIGKISRQPVQKLRSGEEAIETGAFYPDAVDWDSAEKLVLTAGEVRANLTLRLRMNTITEVRGVVRGQDGKPATNAHVRLLPAKGQRFTVSEARTAQDGSFVLDRATAGEYHVVAKSASEVPLWGQRNVTSDGRTPTSVSVDLQPGGTVRGRVVFSRGSIDASQLHIFLNRIPHDNYQYPMSGTSLEFSFRGVPPGRFRISPSPNGPEWRVQSILVDGQDVLDSGFEMFGTEVRDAVVTLSRGQRVLNGTVRNPANKPHPGCTVVVFSPDTRHWTEASMRVERVRPDTKGRFSFHTLPPGEYLVALASADLYGIPDHMGLSALIRDAVRVTLPEDGTVSVDLVAPAGSGLPYARAHTPDPRVNAGRQPVRANGAPSLQAR